jgi:hypothetical protein
LPVAVDPKDLWLFGGDLDRRNAFAMYLRKQIGPKECTAEQLRKLTWKQQRMIPESILLHHRVNLHPVDANDPLGVLYRDYRATQEAMIEEGVPEYLLKDPTTRYD